MSEINFFKFDSGLLIDPSVLSKAVKYIEKENLNTKVKLNFTDCFINYEFATILDAVITKLEKSTAGEKSITIVHQYNESHEGQLVGYFVKESNKIDPSIVRLNELIDYLNANFEITLIFTTG